MKTKLHLLGLLFALLLASPSFALNATWNAATDVPATSNGYTASGTVNFTLNFAPPVGTNLTVVKNTALGFISGTFSNLAQGQSVALSFGGSTYRFVANYYGGTGNDLVLIWASNRPVAWGTNGNGQLGNNSTTRSLVPIAVNKAGVLAGKTIIGMGGGYAHSVAVCSDGTLVTWGGNGSGALGIGSSSVPSLVPVAVNTTGALAGKTPIAVATGPYYSLVLCSDGSVAAWGSNNGGELGNNSTTESNVPVAVNTSGVLAGKTVVAIAASNGHNLALCSDGTLVQGLRMK